MILASVGDGFVLALLFRVVSAHQALQLGKLADDFGEQIRLAQPRGALRLLHVGADERRKLGCEPLDALDALGLRAELLVKHDILELRQPVFEPRLQIGLVEELRIRQPRADHALIAGDDRLAAVGRLDVGNEDELVDQLGVRRIAQHEAFQVGADGGADHLLGDSQKARIERTHQHHRPLDEAGDFGKEALVLDQFEPLRESKLLRLGEDDVAPPLRIEHHLGLVELVPGSRRAGAP